MSDSQERKREFRALIEKHWLPHRKVAKICGVPQSTITSWVPDSTQRHPTEKALQRLRIWCEQHPYQVPKPQLRVEEQRSAAGRKTSNGIFKNAKQLYEFVRQEYFIKRRAYWRIGSDAGVSPNRVMQIVMFFKQRDGLD